MISNSLELLLFLYEHGRDQNIVEPAVEKLDTFTNKWRGGAFQPLDKASTNEQTLNDAFKLGVGEESNYIEYVSIREFNEEALKHQSRIFRVAHAGNLRRCLRSAKKHEKMYSEIRGWTTEGRSLYDLVSLSLGTRSLQPALDDRFGNSIGRIVKNDFAELWFCYFGYILLGEFEKAEELDPLIAASRTTPLLGRLCEKPYTKIYWVH